MKKSSVTKIKYLFQGQFTRSQYWFKLDPDWIEENLSTRDPDIFKRVYQKYITGKSDKYLIIFPVTIRGSNNQVKLDLILMHLP